MPMRWRILNEKYQEKNRSNCTKRFPFRRLLAASGANSFSAWCFTLGFGKIRKRPSIITTSIGTICTQTESKALRRTLAVFRCWNRATHSWNLRRSLRSYADLSKLKRRLSKRRKKPLNDFGRQYMKILMPLATRFLNDQGSKSKQR